MINYWSIPLFNCTSMHPPLMTVVQKVTLQHSNVSKPLDIVLFYNLYYAFYSGSTGEFPYV